MLSFLSPLFANLSDHHRSCIPLCNVCLSAKSFISHTSFICIAHKTKSNTSMQNILYNSYLTYGTTSSKFNVCRNTKRTCNIFELQIISARSSVKLNNKYNTNVSYLFNTYIHIYIKIRKRKEQQ